MINLGQQEIWDIYDKDKKRTGKTMLRDDWRMKEDEYHLSVLGVVVRPDGRFLITKRDLSKPWGPGWWEIPGGAVKAGEDSETAVRREIFEETGLDVNGCAGGYQFCYHRENPVKRDNYFVDIYRFVKDFEEKDVVLQKGETCGMMLATKEEIDAFGKQGIFLHYDSIQKVFEL